METMSFCLAINRYKTLRELNPQDLFRRFLRPPGTCLSEKKNTFYYILKRKIWVIPDRLVCLGEASELFMASLVRKRKTCFLKTHFLDLINTLNYQALG